MEFGGLGSPTYIYPFFISFVIFIHITRRGGGVVWYIEWEGGLVVLPCRE